MLRRAVLLCCCAVLCVNSDAEFKGSWARFHVDLGTADELAFDVLLNMLVGFSFEVRVFVCVGTQGKSIGCVWFGGAGCCGGAVGLWVCMCVRLCVRDSSDAL
jgi:hypothetical protein